MARAPKSTARKGAPKRAAAKRGGAARKRARQTGVLADLKALFAKLLARQEVKRLIAAGQSLGARAPGALRTLFKLPGDLRTMGHTAKVAVPLLVLALGAVSYAGLKATRPDIAGREQQEKVWPVRAAEIEFTNHSPEIRLYGVTIPGRQVELRALVAGQVIEAGKNLRNGGEVKKGDVLLRIDPFEYEGALVETKAQLAESKARLKEIQATIKSEQDALANSQEQLVLAKRDLARAEPLVARGSVSKKLADDRRMVVSERKQAVELRLNNLDIQKARAEQQAATITQLEWKVRQAERNLADTVLKAPFDAYVKTANVDLGRLMNVNDEVATLLDREWIEARFTLTDSQYGRIVTKDTKVTGRTIKVLWRVREEPIEYDAVIERVAAEIVSQDGGVEVYARLKDPLKPIPIRSGAFVEVEARDRSYTNVTRLPQAALYDGNKVFVIVDGRLAERRVEIVGTADDDVLVKGAIAKGDRVVVTRLSNAGEGLAVKEHAVP
jgi:RND family efflux transporter MFP subunit